jgi:hypothetical protein
MIKFTASLAEFCHWEPVAGHCQGDEPNWIESIVDFDFRPFRRREDHVVPAVAGGAAGHDARHHQYHPRATPR